MRMFVLLDIVDISKEKAIQYKLFLTELSELVAEKIELKGFEQEKSEKIPIDEFLEIFKRKKKWYMLKRSGTLIAVEVKG